jgi:hypothetical protein
MPTIATTAPDLLPEPGVHATFAREFEYQRHGARLTELGHKDSPVEMQFSMPDQCSRHQLLALCRRYGLTPYSPPGAQAVAWHAVFQRHGIVELVEWATAGTDTGPSEQIHWLDLDGSRLRNTYPGCSHPAANRLLDIS